MLIITKTIEIGRVQDANSEIIWMMPGKGIRDVKGEVKGQQRYLFHMTKFNNLMIGYY